MGSLQKFVCGAAPQQHHVPAASASTAVLVGDAGRPGTSLPQRRQATQGQIDNSGCADVSIPYGSAQLD